MECRAFAKASCLQHSLITPDLVFKHLSFKSSQGELAILCGAGVSFWSPANMPLGDALRNEIISHLFPEIGESGSRSIPRAVAELSLEATVSKVGWGVEFGLQRVFAARASRPNAWHQFLALLLRCNKSQLIMTLNFDRLIEEAAKESGLVELRDYVSVITESFAGSVRQEPAVGRPVLYHLHGDSEPLTMCSSIPHILDPQLSLSRLTPLTRLLSRSDATLLIVGCSGRDLDIKRMIARLPRKRATVIMVTRGKPGASFTRLRGHFSSFPGFVLRVGGYSGFIRDMQRALLPRTAHRSISSDPGHSDRRWRRAIHSWAREVPKDALPLIRSRLLRRAQPMRTVGNPSTTLCVGQDRVQILRDTIAINVRVRSGRQLWVYDIGRGGQGFLWTLRHGDVRSPLRIDSRHGVFDWPELIRRLSSLGYLPAESSALRARELKQIGEPLCRIEESEIKLYVDRLVERDASSAIYRADSNFRASLALAARVLTSHPFLHLLACGAMPEGHEVRLSYQVQDALSRRDEAAGRTRA